MGKSGNAKSGRDVTGPGVTTGQPASASWLSNLKLMAFAGGLVILLANILLEGAMLTGYASPPYTRAVATQQTGVLTISMCSLAAAFMAYFMLVEWKARVGTGESRRRLEAGASGR